MSRGLFITFEGPEGGGKSTQIARVAEALRERGHTVVVTREPGGPGEFGERVRELLLAGIEVVPRAEMFLFLADRAQHVATVVRPALGRGDIVLCDRYADSTYVYQGVARGMGVELAAVLNDFATEGLLPDLTLILDVPAEVGLSRVPLRDETNRLDKEDVEFHRRVRHAFLDLAKTHPRFRVIDAARSADAVAKDVLNALNDLLAYNRTPGEGEGR